MNIRRLFWGSLMVGAGLALTRKLITTTASAPSITNTDSYDVIDAYIERQMHRFNITGASLAIVEGGQMVHWRGFGKTYLNGDAPTPQTPFFIGSLTKSFTAMAVMQLAEAGKVELDAPVQRYLPWFRVADPHASAQMTVRHLLNQTSGMPGLLGMANLGDFDSHPDATERLARALATLKLTRPVGSAFEYSNANYNVLGLIVQVVSGEAYANFVQRHIFDPLEMRHSYSSKAKAQRDHLAVGHCYCFGIPIPLTNLSIPLGSLPSGQLIASAEDVAHYLIAYLNNGRYKDAQILSPAAIEEMHRPAAEINEMGMALGHYGMGWMIQASGGSQIVWHGGDVPDFGAVMALVPDQNKGMVLLFNANHAMMKLTYDEVGVSVAQLLAGQTPTPHRFDAVPLAMRGLMLIPILQLIGVIGTLRQLRRWRLEPGSRPSPGRMWGRHILLPLIPNLSIALTLIPMLSKMRGFLMFFMPDYSLIAAVCGSFSLVWSFLRTGLILRAMREKD